MSEGQGYLLNGDLEKSVSTYTGFILQGLYEKKERVVDPQIQLLTLLS